MKNGFVAFWMVLGLAALIVVGGNVAVSLHRVSTECNAGGSSWAR